MSSERRQETIPANGQIVLGEANFFFLLSSTLPVQVRFERNGTTFGGSGISGGYIKGNVETWRRATIIGTPGDVVSYFYGVEDISEDFTDYRTQIATIAGITLVTESPSTAVTSPAAANVLTGAAGTIAANAARKRVTIGSPSTNTGSMFVQSVGAGAGRGLELQPGMFIEFKTAAALDVRNDSGATQSYTVFEET